jgi:hypothetical protein
MAKLLMNDGVENMRKNINIQLFVRFSICLRFLFRTTYSKPFDGKNQFFYVY